MKNPILHIDFETRSACDLKKAGAHVYASHPTTDALCMAYALDNGPVKIWILGEPLPDLIWKCMANQSVTFTAQNAQFEFLIWNYVCTQKYKWPNLPIRRMDCTMIRAYNMGLPGSLEMAAKAVGMKFSKDAKGHRIMLQLCKPRKMSDDGKQIQWWEQSDSTEKLNIKEKYEALYRYCKQDIVVERELDKRLLPLSHYEKNLWILDQKINHRGVYLNEKAARKAIIIVKAEQTKFNNSISELTEGEVGTCNSHVALRKWINKKGIKCLGVGKAEVLDLMEGDLPEIVRNALLLRQGASRSSTAKLKAMITSKSNDNRVRGCLQYYGAASTGRWAGRRIQLQNMKRPDITQEEIELIMKKLSRAPADEAREWLNIFHSSAIQPIADCVRAMLQAAPGKKLIAGDWSAIEGRILAWLAGEERTLSIYRGHGRIYEHRATQIFQGTMITNVTKDQRLIGKVAELALGYQGGKRAFQSMAKVYFIKVPDERAEAIKLLWRQANPHIVSYWYNLERAAIAAAQNPGKRFACGPKGRHVIFLKNGSFLFCRLPSGRAMCYPYPKMRLVKTPWGEMKNALTYKGTLYGKFITRVAYGGLLAENITQATARDLLADGLFRVEAAGYPIVMHVHDEIVTELKTNLGSVDELVDLMCTLPDWAKDLPIKAEAWVGERYRK